MKNVFPEPLLHFQKFQDATDKTLRLENNRTDPSKKNASSLTPQVVIDHEEAEHNTDTTSVAKKLYMSLEPSFHSKPQDADDKISKLNNQFTDFYNAKKNPSISKILQVNTESCDAKSKVIYPKMLLNKSDHKERINDPTSTAEKHYVSHPE